MLCRFLRSLAVLTVAAASVAHAEDFSLRIDHATGRAEALKSRIAEVTASRLRAPVANAGFVCRVFGFTPVLLQPGEFTSIQAAIDSTSPHCDTIDVDPLTTFPLPCPGGGPFSICPITLGKTFNESLTINHDLTIEATPSLLSTTQYGISSSAVIAQPPGFSGSIITINSSGSPAPVVNFKSITISGGAASTNGGGINNNGGVVTIDHCNITGNVAGRRGGGIYNSNVGAIMITNSYIAGNFATIGGGAIANSSATKLSVSLLSIQNTTIENNSVKEIGGAIDQDFGITLITDSTIRGNSCSTLLGAYGGAINNNLGGMSIKRTTIANNSVTSTLATPPVAGTAISAAGGAINNTGSLVDNNLGVMILDTVLIAGNSAKSIYGANGGGINNTAGGTVTMTDSAVLNNFAPSGGGLDNGFDGIVSIVRSTFAFNTAASGLFAQGGGLRNNDAEVLIRDSAFIQNQATGSGRGGAIYFAAKDQGSHVTLENSTFSANVAKGGIGAQGGAVYVNAAGGGLPGVSATIDVHNCTFASNDATSDGESFYILGDLATVNINFSNTILAGLRSRLPRRQLSDPPGNYYSANCKSTSLTSSAHFNSSGHNIDLDATCGLDNSTDRSNSDPLLGSLALRGGGTAVHSLLVGSPAIDAVAMGTGQFGDPLTTDQRGVSRPQNILADIGAFEKVLGGLTSFAPQFYPNQTTTTVRATVDSTPKVPFASDALVVQSEKRPAMRGTMSLAAGNVATFTPTTPIPPNEVIRATATANLVRADGTPLQNPSQWWFEAQGPQWCVGGWSAHQDLQPSILGGVVAFGDFDGDGDLDLVATGSGLGQGSDIFRNDNGTFVPLHAGLPNLQYANVAWVDIDGDGDLDLAISGRLIVPPGTFIDGYTEIWRNDNGTFTPMQAGFPQFNSATFAFGDYDNDGKPDLFLSGSLPLGPGQLQTISTLYHNEGNGAFKEVPILVPGFVRAAWGDYDNDGFLDLAVAGYYGTYAYILHSDGAGHFGNPIQLATPVSLGRLAWGDYDGDGRLDLLVGGQVTAGTNVTPTITLYHNDLNHTFAPVSTPFVATSDGDLAFIDFDNDGKQDVSIAGTNGGAMVFKLYRNQGGGTFAEVPTTVPGAGTGSLSWGDYDNDGHIDLALSGFDGTTWFRKIFHHDPCTAVNDTYTATAGTPLVVPATTGVLANDQTLLGATAVRDTNALHGTASVNSDGSFTYNPPVGSTGPDSFTYHMIDASGGTSNIATVNINVSASSAQCSSTVDGIFGWTSADASAVQLAIDAASAGATVKVAGTCTGTTAQIALVSKNLTLKGGYVSSNWNVSDPVANPTVLDAAGGGRVVLTTGASTAVTLDSLTMRNGFTNANGGNIEAAGPLTIARSTVAGGRAPNAAGGGIDARGPLTIGQSLISGNSAPAGAGIFAAGATLDVRNTTISGNTGGSGGGGIEIAGATATINNVTIAGNTAGAGSIFFSSGSASIANSILASSTPNCGAGITSGGFNVSTDATCTGGPGDLANTNPLLNALASNGGPTQTRSLPKGSPAVDLASTTCEAIDQRGVARPAAAGCDAGAFEAPDFRSCNAKVTSNSHVFSGAASDANAIRLAIADAATTDQILLSGNCTGLHDFGGFTAMAFVSGKTLTFSGGYDPLSFARRDPVAFPTILDGTPGVLAAGPIFRINTGSAHTFNDITFTNARLRAFNLDGSGGATFNRCTFTANTSNDGGQGGGAFHIDGGTLTFNESAFNGNSSTGIAQGGAIDSFGSVVLNNTTFTNNTASGASTSFGGALLAIGSITATNSTFTGNTALSNGGAICAFAYSTFSHCTFNGNRVTTTNGNGGGALFVSDGGASIDSSTFTSNSAVAGGGAIFFNNFLGPNSTVSNSTFSSNTAPSDIYGGAIYNSAGRVVMTNSTLTSNSAGDGGAVINFASMTIDRCLIDSNASTLGGEGGLNNLSSMSITNTTLSRNTGQIAALAGGGLTCTNCTLVGNRATNPGLQPLINFRFSNSIFSGNGCVGSVSLGHNVSDNSNCGATATDHPNVSPQLGPLQDNGGPTLTYDLAITSPALDAGDCAGGTITVDQRGVVRPHGAACDSGAVEHKGIDTTTLIGSTLPSSVFGQNGTFTATVSAVSGPVPTGNVTFLDGATPLATVPLTSGLATFTTSSLSVATHAISASFPASSTLEPSVSATIPFTVNKASTTVVVVGATPEPGGANTPATITFGLHVNAPGSGLPSGTVTVTDGTTTCSAALPAASCNLTFPAVGTHLLSASYPGDANFAASASPSLFTHNVVDAIPPRVAVVNSVADTGDAVLAENEAVTVPVTQLLMKFSKSMHPALAANVANYMLVSHDGATPVTTGCSTLGAGDVVVPLETAFYDPTTTTATIGVPVSLPLGNYRLIVCSAVTDLDGRALDGNGDGTAGDPFLRTFSVSVPPRVTIAGIDDAQIVRVSTTQLVAKFDQTMTASNPGGANDATNPANYLLVRPGANGVFDTAGCSAGLAGDDVRISVTSVSMTGNDATLNAGGPLPDSRYRMIVCSAIHAVTGAALDGNADAVAGDDFTRGFIVDLNPPAGTTLISTTHIAGSWSKMNDINMQWSGTIDAVGVAGYTVLFDMFATTDPGSVITIAQGTDPQNLSSGPLADGASYFFHLRACDVDSNCTAPLHRGTFMIDTVPPTAPSAVSSTSHAINVPTIVPSISMTWSAATDVTSGVAGYGYAFDQNPAWTCDQVNRMAAPGVSSAPLIPGTWYFHVCAADRASNWSPSVTTGPYLIETSTIPHVITTTFIEGQASNTSVAQLAVTFDQDLIGADGVSSYQLVETGSGPDVPVTIDSVAYDAVTHVATLHVNGGTLLSDSRYRFTVSHTIHNAASVELDGNLDGVPGDDFVRNFIIDTHAPTDPTTTSSTTHTAGTWSRLSTIGMRWSGAADNIAIAGYSVLFDHNATSLPDSTIDVPQTSDPHTTSSGVLSDGIYYFHLRTCDLAGNCTSTVHAGPYQIDTAPPSVPAAIVSSSHQVGVPAAAHNIAVSWTAAADALSGIAGYGYQFDASPTWPCDQVNRLTGTAITSAALRDGTWYFHVCAADTAGNWSPAATAGPFIVQTPLPPGGIPALTPWMLILFAAALAIAGAVISRR